MTLARWRSFWIVILVAIVAWAFLATFLFPDQIRDGVLILIATGLAVPAFQALRSDTVGRWVEPATAENLGAIRIIISSILLASVLWEDISSSAYLPRGMLDLDRSWLISILYNLPIGFDRLLVSPSGLEVFSFVTAGLLALAAAGVFTRWTVPLGAVAYMVFAVIPRSYSWTYHTGVIPLYAMLLLSFTPCGDGLSVDRALRARRGLYVAPWGEKSLVYGLGRYLIWMGVTIPYTLAGMSKLRNTGVMWWEGEHLRQMIIATIVEPMHFNFQLAYRINDGPTWMFGILGFVALVTEVTFVAILVSRAARRILPVLMASTHVGILFLQNILFPDLIAIQAVFYDWPSLWRRSTARVNEATAHLRNVGRTVRIQSAAAQGFLCLALFVWATRTEKFPLTAMQMFSRPIAVGPVEYVVPVVYYADGSHEQARFERWIGAVADTRYRRLIRDWYSKPERLPLLHEFLDAAARRVNATASPARKIDHFVLEVRRWDFRKDSGDPSRGDVIRAIRYDTNADDSGNGVPGQ